MKRIYLSTIFIILTTIIVCTAIAENKYVKITGKRVNLRLAPNTSCAIVATAQEGDVFELRGESREWYRISMFSREWRYVHKSLAEPTAYVISLPRESSTRRDIFRALLRAEDRAQAQADKKYPLVDKRGRPISENLEKNFEYTRLLDCRYKLKTMHKFGVDPPIYKKIVAEGVRSHWFE